MTEGYESRTCGAFHSAYTRDYVLFLRLLITQREKVLAWVRVSVTASAGLSHVSESWRPKVLAFVYWWDKTGAGKGGGLGEWNAKTFLHRFAAGGRFRPDVLFISLGSHVPV